MDVLEVLVNDIRTYVERTGNPPSKLTLGKSVADKVCKQLDIDSIEDLKYLNGIKIEVEDE